VQARLEDAAQCLLVIIGTTPEGKKELVGLIDGVRESAQSWKELLLDLKRRALTIGPELAVADGALGFWQAIEEVWPKTRGQRCWVGSLKKWPPHRLYAAIGPVTALTSKPAPRRDLRNASGLQGTIQRRRSARRAAASRLRLMRPPSGRPEPSCWRGRVARRARAHARSWLRHGSPLIAGDAADTAAGPLSTIVHAAVVHGAMPGTSQGGRRGCHLSRAFFYAAASFGIGVSPC
jgi:hypothetical protein